MQLQEVAREAAHEVFAADDLSEAREIVATVTPDLVVFDGSFAPHHLRDCLGEIAQDARELPLTAVIAAGASPFSEAEYRQAGICIYLTGPDGSAGLRDIATAAGVTHPLVHRYFGTKQQMVAEILRREMELVGAVGTAAPTESSTEPLERLRVTLRFVLKESRTTLLLLLRAQLDGMGSENVLEGVNSPLAILMEWLRSQETPRSEQQLKMLAVGMGAAVFGYVAAAPWFLREVGLQELDEEVADGQFVDMLVDVMVSALAAPSQATQHGAVE